MNTAFALSVCFIEVSPSKDKISTVFDFAVVYFIAEPWNLSMSFWLKFVVVNKILQLLQVRFIISRRHLLINRPYFSIYCTYAKNDVCLMPEN